MYVLYQATAGSTYPTAEVVGPVGAVKVQFRIEIWVSSTLQPDDRGRISITPISTASPEPVFARRRYLSSRFFCGDICVESDPGGLERGIHQEGRNAQTQGGTSGSRSGRWECEPTVRSRNGGFRPAIDAGDPTPVMGLAPERRIRRPAHGMQAEPMTAARHRCRGYRYLELLDAVPLVAGDVTEPPPRVCWGSPVRDPISMPPPPRQKGIRSSEPSFGATS